MEKVIILTKSFIEKIIELIFPPVCAFCEKLDKNFLCEDCKKKLVLIEELHIDRYNAKINCKNYDEHIYLFKYEGYIRERIIDYKFNDKPYYYKSFAKILLNNKKMCEILKSYDIIIPVPIHNKRRKERGYNQTELVAMEISEILSVQEKRNLSYNTNLNINLEGLKYANILRKRLNTKPQSRLNKEERIQNAKNVYELKNDSKLQKNLYQKRILIFDDIYTTGSTVNECAKVIRKLNPKKLGILTIAKD